MLDSWLGWPSVPTRIALGFEGPEAMTVWSCSRWLYQQSVAKRATVSPICG